MTTNLDAIGEGLRAHFEAQHNAREQTLRHTRDIIRIASLCIRAIHRHDWEQATAKLEACRELVQHLLGLLADYPGLYYGGNTQDALKEYAEAALTFALVRQEPLPTPESLDILPSTYVGGLAEAATELRRQILDIIRSGEEEQDRAEAMLEMMDSIYLQLITMDFPDMITAGLRRRTDILRGVLERTRGDLTMSLRQQRLERALQATSTGHDDPPSPDTD